MTIIDKTDTYCIIGAGASGITATKNLLQKNIPCEVIEREDAVGGNWYFGKPNSSVYKSTHLLSSKPMTAYTDYPMPEDDPDYLRHDQVVAYLRDYARHFGVTEHIQFNTSFEQCERDDDGLWLVTLDNGETRRYKGLIICNGHHWHPNMPNFPGEFNGTILHTKQYKTPDVLRGKRVLVVGAGNSGCDLVVEAVHHADKVYHSTRRGYYYIPKYVFGKPSDQVDQVARKLRVPKFLRRISNMLLIKAILGDPTSYGLRKPDHKLLETHPIVNSQMLYHVGHGDVIPKPNVESLAGDSVKFVDGTSAEVDVIIYATGFQIRFPFIDDSHLNWVDGGPKLHLHFAHPEYDNLFVIGLLQPDSGMFWLMDMQAQIVSRFIHAQTYEPTSAQAFRQRKAQPSPDMRGGTTHVNSPRHYLEIDHFVYKGHLKKLLKILPQYEKRTV